jgi:hypothetical protein
MTKHTIHVHQFRNRISKQRKDMQNLYGFLFFILKGEAKYVIQRNYSHPKQATPMDVNR